MGLRADASVRAFALGAGEERGAGHEWPYSDPGNATDDTHLLDFLKNISTTTA